MGGSEYDRLPVLFVGECRRLCRRRLEAELDQVAGQLPLPSQVLVVVETRIFTCRYPSVEHRELQRQPRATLDDLKLRNRWRAAAMSDQRVTRIL